MPVSVKQLTIDGGEPLRRDPFAPWPHFSEEEIVAAEEVLRSGKVNYWTGEEGRKFEIEYAASLGVKHAIVLANGSLALELALMALDIGPGDEVITTPRSFIASTSCAVMRGAKPVFADVDRDSGCITAETIREKITAKTKAIIPVHLGGWPAEMTAIMALAADQGITVVEDCAQANGAKYDGKPIGSFGKVNAFSFCQDKIITTAGEGGMVATNDESLWRKMWAYKDHGKNYETVHKKEHPPGFRWLHESFGTNWRLTEIQSAIGRIQLRKISHSVEARRKNAMSLQRRFAHLPALRVTVPEQKCEHAYYKYYTYVRPERLRTGWNRDRIMNAVQMEGVPCFSGSCSEIYLEKAFPQEWRPVERLPVAKELGETSLMFLVHPTLKEEDMDDTARAVEAVMAAATR